MVDAGRRITAELAYQRALSALHDAREQLAEVAAARRRLAYDRVRMDSVESSARAQELDSRFAEVSARVAGLRDAAEQLRDDVRRLGDDSSVEPAEVPEPTAIEGFEQPPYPEQER